MRICCGNERRKGRSESRRDAQKNRRRQRRTGRSVGRLRAPCEYSLPKTTAYSRTASSDHSANRAMPSGRSEADALLSVQAFGLAVRRPWLPRGRGSKSCAAAHTQLEPPHGATLMIDDHVYHVSPRLPARSCASVPMPVRSPGFTLNTSAVAPMQRRQMNEAPPK